MGETFQIFRLKIGFLLENLMIGEVELYRMVKKIRNFYSKNLEKEMSCFIQVKKERLFRKHKLFLFRRTERKLNKTIELVFWDKRYPKMSEVCCTIKIGLYKDLNPEPADYLSVVTVQTFYTRN